MPTGVPRLHSGGGKPARNAVLRTRIHTVFIAGTAVLLGIGTASLDSTMFNSMSTQLNSQRKPHYRYHDGSMRASPSFRLCTSAVIGNDEVFTYLNPRRIRRTNMDPHSFFLQCGQASGDAIIGGFRIRPRKSKSEIDKPSDTRFRFPSRGENVDDDGGETKFPREG
ncbi:hypothetical protein C8R43DRAFT_1174396 [Mycena crocata]|nr:hypothetical protein C8R43DRAFT_1174396 [Mycena crocata]